VRGWWVGLKGAKRRLRERESLRVVLGLELFMIFEK
jgi:hypothetical protein